MVIVTTAVYKVLDSLYWTLNYLHWAGLTNYTHFYKFAVGCVFDKQSDGFDLLDFFISKEASIIPKFLL